MAGLIVGIEAETDTGDLCELARCRFLRGVACGNSMLKYFLQLTRRQGHQFKIIVEAQCIGDIELGDITEFFACKSIFQRCKAEHISACHQPIAIAVDKAEIGRVFSISHDRGNQGIDLILRKLAGETNDIANAATIFDRYNDIGVDGLGDGKVRIRCQIAKVGLFCAHV